MAQTTPEISLCEAYGVCALFLSMAVFNSSSVLLLRLIFDFLFPSFWLPSLVNHIETEAFFWFHSMSKVDWIGGPQGFFSMTV